MRWAIVLLLVCNLARSDSYEYSGVNGMLDLSGHRLNSTNITKDTFTVGNTDVDNIVALNLTNNSIASVDVDAFDVFFNVKELHLSHNDITFLHNETFTSLRKLEKLFISYNKLTELRIGLVSILTLKEVYFDNNNISYVEPGIVSSVNRDLMLFDMKNNSLEYMDPWMYITHVTHNRSVDRVFDLRNNNVRELTNKMGWSYNLTYPFEVEVLLQNNDVQTINLNLLKQYDQNVTMDDSAFAMFMTLYVNVTSNPFVCDCNVYDISALVRNGVFRFTRVDEWRYRCKEPAHLEGWDFIHDIPLDQLVCNLTVDEGCPAGCFCQDRPDSDTFFVDCRGAGLTRLPETLMDKSRSFLEIHADDNAITGIHNVPYLGRITNLTLRNNHISVLEPEILKTMNAEHLDLRSNRLKNFPKEIKKFESVLLTGNPLECDCSSMWMKEWMDIDSRIADPGLYCEANGGRHYIMDMTLRDLGCTNEKVIIAATVIGVLIIGVVIGVIVAKRCPYTTKVLMNKFLGVHSGDKYKCDTDTDKVIDAYLVFDHHDKDVIGYIRYFLHKLNKKKPLYSILNPAQFMEAGPEQRNISRYIGKSRRVVVFLSKNIFDDEWRMAEIDEAEHRVIEEQTIRNNEKAQKSKGTVDVEKGDTNYIDLDKCQEDEGDNSMADENNFRKEENESLKAAPKIIYIIYNNDEKLKEHLETEVWKTRLASRAVLLPDPDDRLFWAKFRYEMPKKGTGNGKPFMPFKPPEHIGIVPPTARLAHPEPSPINPRKPNQKQNKPKVNVKKPDVRTLLAGVATNRKQNALFTGLTHTPVHSRPASAESNGSNGSKDLKRIQFIGDNKGTNDTANALLQKLKFSRTMHNNKNIK